MTNALIEIKSVLETVRPAMQADGGDVQVVEVDYGSGLVTVRLCGTCIGCPSKNMTMKHGIEKSLKAELPWVTEVVRVD